MRPAGTALGIAILLTSAAVAGQDRPRFQTTTRLVQVSVVVQDRSGQPVAGLTATNFELIENGRPQAIAHVSAFDAGTRHVALAAVPNTFSNSVAGSRQAGATIILFDRVNTPRLNQQEARQAVLAFLKQLDPADRIGFYVLEADRVRILHDFTRDASSLLAALGGLRTGADAAVTDPATSKTGETPAGMTEAESRRALEDWLARPDPVADTMFRDRVKSTVAALEAVAQRLAGVPGRKSVIWLSGGLPIDVAPSSGLATMDRDVSRAARALSHADVAIYPVDATGLADGLGFGADGDRPPARGRPVVPAYDTSRRVAEQTGGRAYRNRNDLRIAMREALDDSRATYVLGYYPADDRWDGRFRRIEVRVSRPHVQVRHRTGYFAHPPEAVVAAARKTALIDAMAHPLEATGLTLSVTVQPAGDGTWSVAMHLDPTAIALERRGERWSGSLEFAIAQRHRDRSMSSSAFVSAPIDFSEDVHERFLATGLTVTRTVTLREDAVHLVIGAHDRTSGAVGTVIIDVPNLPTRTRHPAPGTRHPAPGTRHPAPGTPHPAAPRRTLPHPAAP